MSSITERIQLADTRIRLEAVQQSGKLFGNITSTELRAMQLEPTSLEGKAAWNRIYRNKWRVELSVFNVQLLASRWANWDSRGRPANEVIIDSEGNPILLEAKGV